MSKPQDVDWKRAVDIVKKQKDKPKKKFKSRDYQLAMHIFKQIDKAHRGKKKKKKKKADAIIQLIKAASWLDSKGELEAADYLEFIVEKLAENQETQMYAKARDNLTKKLMEKRAIEDPQTKEQFDGALKALVDRIEIEDGQITTLESEIKRVEEAPESPLESKDQVLRSLRLRLLTAYNRLKEKRNRLEQWKIKYKELAGKDWVPSAGMATQPLGKAKVEKIDPDKAPKEPAKPKIKYDLPRIDPLEVSNLEFEKLQNRILFQTYRGIMQHDLNEAQQAVVQKAVLYLGAALGREEMQEAPDFLGDKAFFTRAKVDMGISRDLHVQRQERAGDLLTSDRGNAAIKQILDAAVPRLEQAMEAVRVELEEMQGGKTKKQMLPQKSWFGMKPPQSKEEESKLDPVKTMNQLLEIAFNMTLHALRAVVERIIMEPKTPLSIRRDPNVKQREMPPRLPKTQRPVGGKLPEMTDRPDDIEGLTRKSPRWRKPIDVDVVKPKKSALDVDFLVALAGRRRGRSGDDWMSKVEVQPKQPKQKLVDKFETPTEEVMEKMMGTTKEMAGMSPKVSKEAEDIFAQMGVNWAAFNAEIDSRIATKKPFNHMLEMRSMAVDGVNAADIKDSIPYRMWDLEKKMMPLDEKLRLHKMKQAPLSTEEFEQVANKLMDLRREYKRMAELFDIAHTHKVEQRMYSRRSPDIFGREPESKEESRFGKPVPGESAPRGTEKKTRRSKTTDMFEPPPFTAWKRRKPFGVKK